MATTNQRQMRGVPSREALNKATFVDFWVGRGRGPLARAINRALSFRFAGPSRRADAVFSDRFLAAGRRRPMSHAAARTRSPITTFASPKRV